MKKKKPDLEHAADLVFQKVFRKELETNVENAPEATDSNVPVSLPSGCAKCA